MILPSGQHCPDDSVTYYVTLFLPFKGCAQIKCHVLSDTMAGDGGPKEGRA